MITALTPARLAAAAAFVAERNPDARQHCGYAGEDLDDVTATLTQLLALPHAGFVVAEAAGEITGVLGFDADTELGRAWLYGPWLRTPEPAQADALWQALAPMLPPGVHELELFCTREHTTCHEFAASHGFDLHSADVILVIDHAGAATLPPAPDVHPLAPGQYPAFAALHDSLFPRTYKRGAEIVAHLSPHCHVLVIGTAPEVLGYLVAEHPELDPCGSIAFVGVAPAVRHHGLGHQLIAAGVRLLLADPAVQRVQLACNAQNTAALHVYATLGFQVLRAMVTYRRTSI